MNLTLQRLTARVCVAVEELYCCLHFVACMMMIPLVFALYIFDFTEENKGNRMPLYFCFSFDIYSRMYLNFHVVCLCVRLGLFGCLMTGLIIYLFQDFQVTFRWFQKVLSRCFHKPGIWYLKARVGRLFGLCVVWETLSIQKVSQTQYRRNEKWCVDVEALSVTSLKLPLWLLLNERSDPSSLQAVLLRLTSEKSCGRLSETMRHWLLAAFYPPRRVCSHCLQLTLPRCY